MPKDTHPEEEFLDLLEEAFNHDLEMLLEYAQTDEGRFMFTVLLTPQEQLADFRNPQKRAAIEADQMMQGGPEAVREYHSKMLNYSVNDAVKRQEVQRG